MTTSKRREPRPLIDLRFLLLATVSVLTGAIVGLITWRATDNPWTATLAGMAAAAVALERLHKWTR